MTPLLSPPSVLRLRNQRHVHGDVDHLLPGDPLSHTRWPAFQACFDGLVPERPREGSARIERLQRSGSFGYEIDRDELHWAANSPALPSVAERPGTCWSRPAPLLPALAGNAFLQAFLRRVARSCALEFGRRSLWLEVRFERSCARGDQPARLPDPLPARPGALWRAALLAQRSYCIGGESALVSAEGEVRLRRKLRVTGECLLHDGSLELVDVTPLVALSDLRHGLRDMLHVELHAGATTRWSKEGAR